MRKLYTLFTLVFFIGACSSSSTERGGLKTNDTPSLERVSYTDPKDVRLDSQSLLLVTHAANRWDSYNSAKRAIDILVSGAKKSAADVVYLERKWDEFHKKGDQYDEVYYVADKSPAARFASYEGEFSSDFAATKVISVGGYFEGCKTRSIAEVLRVWTKRQPKVDLELIEPAEAIFTYGDFVRTFRELETSFSDFRTTVVYDYTRPVMTLGMALRFLKAQGKDIARVMAAEYVSFQKIFGWEFPLTHKVVVLVDGENPKVIANESVVSPTLRINVVTRHERVFANGR